MIDAVRKTGIDYEFYCLGNDLRMDVENFVKINRPVNENDAIILVNYFGLVDVELTINRLRERGVHSVIIEDDVQALFSFLDDKPYAADFRFTSLRKSIAAPDGGLVRTLKRMPLAIQNNTFAPMKLKGALLKSNTTEGGSDEIYLKCFEEGEELIEENYDSVMSTTQVREYHIYSSGRAALYQILMSIKLTTFKVWLPDWLCESMIDAVRKTGIDYEFYCLGNDLRMDVENFVKINRPVNENDAIILVNYFIGANVLF